MGRFAHVAWVHGAMLDFRNVSEDRAELYNRVGDPFVAIHLWSSDSPVGQQVVLPFVKEFEPKLLGQSAQNGSSSSGRSAFDPRYQLTEEVDIGKLLGSESEESYIGKQADPVDESSLSAVHAVHSETQSLQSDEPVAHSRRPQRRGTEYHERLKGVGSV